MTRRSFKRLDLEDEELYIFSDLRRCQNMANWFRVVAECENYPMTIQVALRERRLDSKMIYLGWSGPLKDSYPFVLMRDGRIDYGCEFDPLLYRFSQTNLYER